MESLDLFVGGWSVEAVFPQQPDHPLGGGRTTFEWMKGQKVLVQRSEIALLDVPDAIAIIVPDAGREAYTQHYFDSRGVVRLYAMTLDDDHWTLVRTSPDFSPLDFSQRYIGTIEDGGKTIRGAWEKSADGSHWEKDFDLSYRKVK